MGVSSFGAKLRSLLLSEEELEAAELREAAEGAGAQTLASCPMRSHVTLQGTVTSVTADADHGWLEAEMSDGSGTVRLIWMGRDRLTCVLPGRRIRVSGRLAEADGRTTIYNPDYEIVKN